MDKSEEKMKNIIKDIKNREFKRSYLLYGEEDYLKNFYRDKLVNTITDGDTMNYSRYSGKGIDANEVIDFAETMPFFADYRVILMENTGMFKSGGDELAQYIEKTPVTTVFIFVESEVDKRNKLFKAVSKCGYVSEMRRQSEDALVSWAAGMLAKDNKKITRETMLYILSKTGTDMEILSKEIEKLICYVGENEVITKEDVDAVCITRISVRIFDMIDAISAKNQKKTLDLYYDLLASKEPPMRILFMLSRQFNNMLQAKELNELGNGRSEIAKFMGVQEFVAGKCVNQSRNFTAKALKNALAESVSTEESIKSGRMDEKIGVEMLLIKYSKK